MKILMTTCGGFVNEMESWSERLLAKELIKLGHEVEAITTSSVLKAFPNAKKQETIDGIKVKRFNPLSPSSLLYMLKNDWDLIHAHFPGYMAPLSSWAALRKKIKNIPLIHTVHGLYHDPFLVKDTEDPFANPIRYKNMKKSILHPLNWFAHLPIFKADKVLPQNKYEFNELKKYGIPANKMTITPTSGIDMKKYKNLPPKNYFKNKHNIKGKFILFVGQPVRRKGPKYLIEAFRLMQKQEPNITLVFIGYRKSQELEQLSKGLNIKFLGFLPEKEKIAAYQDADVFCLPTLYEGFGLIFLEAMATRTPIVTTNTPGISELVENKKNGLLVPTKDPISTARAIIKLLNNKQLTNSIRKNNLAKAKQYDWPIIAKKIEGVYLESISQKNRAKNN